MSKTIEEKVKKIADNLCTTKNEILYNVTLNEVNEYLKIAAIQGYQLCQKEYEERLRWIPVEERLPELKKEKYRVETILKNGLRDYWYIECQYDIDTLKEYRTFWRYAL